jgi:hypothetical protein
MNFDDFYPSWRNTALWEQWRKYARFCFGTGVLCICDIYCDLIDIQMTTGLLSMLRQRLIRHPFKLSLMKMANQNYPQLLKRMEYKPR